MLSLIRSTVLCLGYKVGLRRVCISEDRSGGNHSETFSLGLPILQIRPEIGGNRDGKHCASLEVRELNEAIYS